MLDQFCDDFSPHSLTAGQEPDLPWSQNSGLGTRKNQLRTRNRSWHMMMIFESKLQKWLAPVLTMRPKKSKEKRLEVAA
jgi:hypothetical protein